MRHFLTFAWRRHPVACAVLAIGIVALLFFAVRLGGEALNLAGPETHNRPVQTWMSPRYVERSWGLSGPEMAEITGIDPGTLPGDMPRTIGGILTLTGMSLEEFQSRLDATQPDLRDGDGR